MNLIYLPETNSVSFRTLNRTAAPITCKFDGLLIMFLLFFLAAPSYAMSTSLSEEAIDFADCTPTLWYRDYDGDGYGSMHVSISACVQPSGYVADNTDCNDFNASVNPGNTEIYFNGFDDDCTETQDDGAWIITRVIDDLHNTTLPDIASRIDAYPVESATAYKFEVLTISNGTIQTVITTNPYFHLTDLPIHNYGTTYRIQIMIQRHFAPGNVNVWLGYFGQPRMVSTPSLASTLVFQGCGEEIESNGMVGVKPIVGATQYRFKVKQHQNDLYPVVFTQPSPSFNIANLYTYTYGAVYYVAVAVKIGNGAFSAYGQECALPTVSPDSFVIKQCGFFYGSVNMLVSAQAVPHAQEYRFRVFNPTTAVEQVIHSPIGTFYLSEISNLQVNSEYIVSVAARSGGGWSEYGPTCSFHSPPVGIVVDSNNYIRTNRRVTAAPNPFPNTFTLHIEGAETGNADIQIYDMVGKLVESRVAPANDLPSIEVGANLPAGIYNVVVAQANNVQNIKVVKK